MDANGTRFHLLLGRDDWISHLADPAAAGLSWDAGSETLTLVPSPPRIAPRPDDRGVEPSDRRGAGRDRYGHWYWIGPASDEILIRPHGASATERYWPPAGGDDCAPARSEAFTDAGAEAEPGAGLRLLGLAVTKGHYLLVGAPDLPGLLVFDLHGGGPPRPVRWPEVTGGFRPFDMSPEPDGGAWILDTPEVPGTRSVRLWRLDRNLRVVSLTGVTGATECPPPDFVPKDEPTSPPEGPPTASDHIDPAAAAVLDARQPISVEAVGDGSVLVLDVGLNPGTDPSTIDHFRGGLLLGRFGPVTSTTGGLRDLAYVPDRPEVPTDGRVLVVDRQGDQVFEHRFRAGTLTLDPTPAYLPIRLFTGKGLVVAAGKAYYDMGDHWLPVVDWRRPAYASSAVLTTPAGGFDSREPACVWHRVLLDACIPDGTGVGVESRAADDEETLALSPWRQEPALYRRARGSELPAHRFGSDDDRHRGTWEVLLQHATGRYAQLRLTIRGDGRRSPRLWALRLHYPRFSYLRAYLPDAYQDDETSAWFLDRYLANPEGTFTTLEDRIAAFQAVLDSDTVDGEYLDWLATWFGAVLDPDWDDDRRRLLLRHAVALFARRGTVRGLVEAIRLAVDPCPDDTIFHAPDRRAFGVRIVERFRTRTSPAVVVGDPTEAAGPSMAVAADRWTPDQGGTAIHQRYAEYLEGRYGSVAALAVAWTGAPAPGSFDDVRFPPLTPAHPAPARDRRAFLRARVDPPYADLSDDDTPLYRRFLADRYVRPAVFDRAWGRMGSSRHQSFDDVELPETLPSDGVPLLDWIQFVSVYLPAVRSAHGFSVLVPIRPQDTDDERALRLGRVRRVVVAERPGHTWFDLRPYWAALRVGEARVGLETVVGEGSRFTAMALGQGRLAQTHTPGAHPWDVADRFVVGRDAPAPQTGPGSPQEGSLHG